MDSREAKIQRQHSQEMALRFLTAQKAKAADSFTLEIVKEATDWFERDIQDAVALRERSNGKVETVPADENVEVLTLDAAILLAEKIKGTPKELHPMIQTKMTSLGCKQTKNLLQAIGSMSPTDATSLEDHIDSLVDQS